MNSHNLPQYDIVVRNAKIYDGSGSPPYTADIVIDDQVIVEIGNLTDVRGDVEIDANEMAVAPGFIRTLLESLIMIFLRLSKSSVKKI